MAYLRLLFWLKWKLLWRGYVRQRSALFGVIVAVIVFLPVALGIAFGCAVAFLKLPPPANEQLLRGVLLGIYLFWLLVPLLGYALSDTYDITKLFLYPLTARQIFTGAILGSLIDFPVLLLMPTLVAILIGFSRGVPAFLLVLPAVALFLFHTLSLSQAIVLASAGILRTRRFRDIATILIPLIWMTYYIASRLLMQRMIRIDWAAFLHSRVWEALGWLPPGIAARSIAAAGRGELSLSLSLLLGLLLFSAGTIYLAGWLVEKVYAGEAVASGQWIVARKGGRSDTGRQAPVARARGGGALSSLATDHWPLTTGRLPPVVEAVVDKELKYLWRDPYFKIALMNLVYMLCIGAFAVLGRSGGAGLGGYRPALVWGATGWIMLSEMQLAFNCFGTEGGAAASLFLFPSSRRQILIGKNLTLFAALSLVNLCFLLLLAALAGDLEQFGLLFGWMELALLVMIALGNLISIWFPVRIVLRGWRIRQQSASRGTGYGFLYLGFLIVAFLLLLPVLAALLVPTYLVSPVWFLLALPVAIAYAAGLYLLSLHLGEGLLLERETTLIARLGAEE